MKLTNLVLLYFLLLNYSCKSQEQVSRINIAQPTVEQEASSIWRTINDYTFLEKQGYVINLPNDALIDSLIMKSKNGTFGTEDFSSIYALLENKFFKSTDYVKARQNVENNIDLLNGLVDEIDMGKNQWDWEFNMFENYQVVFTLYGTGGSYDPDTGVITLLTNKNGLFMKYKNPAYTIIHEISHMGMEYSIVQKYKLPHGLKERLVDTFVYLMFSKELPEYKIQDMGDQNIDKYLKKKENIGSLDSIMNEFVQK